VLTQISGFIEKIIGAFCSKFKYLTMSLNN